MKEEKLSGADALVRALADQGVKQVFGYPGGAALHIYDALFRQEKVEHILVRHEQGATHMADGYARATGKPGTVLVTSGPGATNTITGLATAFMDSTPIVIISGQVATSLIGQDAFQETDMIGVSRPVVKHNFLVKDPRDIPRTIRLAYHIASSGRPGPVVVDIPKDVTDPEIKVPYKFPAETEIRSYKPVAQGHPGQIRKAIGLLLRSKRPIIYAGGGAVIGQASPELKKLNQLLKIPVTNTLMGLGCYPGSDPLFTGMLGMHGTVAANNAMHYSDCIFAVGARFDDRIVNNPEMFCPGASVIHIDIDPANISKTITANVPIVGPAKQVLTTLIKGVEEQKDKMPREVWDAWVKKVDDWKKKYPLKYKAGESPMKPQEAVDILQRMTAKLNPFVTSDVGQHQMFAAQYFPFNEPLRWINSGGLGTMGFGLPAAMGAHYADPGRPVFCVTGEGSIQMCIQELSTCAQYEIPVKIFSLNNGTLGMVKQWQDMQYGGRHSHSYMKSLPDFVSLTEAYGHIGIKAETPKQVEKAIEDSLGKHKDRLVFMDIAVCPVEHVYPMQIKGGAVNKLWLDKEEQLELAQED